MAASIYLSKAERFYYTGLNLQPTTQNRKKIISVIKTDYGFYWFDEKLFHICIAATIEANKANLQGPIFRKQNHWLSVKKHCNMGKYDLFKISQW